MSDTKFIQLSSKFRTNPSNDPSECTIDIPLIMRRGKYRLCSAVIPNSFYNVNISNDSIQTELLANVGVYYTTTLTHSNYTLSEFMAHVKTKLEATWTDAGYPTTVNITHDTQTNKLTFSSTAQAWGFIDSDITTAKALLGITNLWDQDTNYIYAGSMVNLQPIHSLNISISGLSSNIYSVGSLDASFVIPIPVESLAYINYTASDTFDQIIELRENRRTISIIVRDDEGHIISLNGVDYSLLLEYLGETIY